MTKLAAELVEAATEQATTREAMGTAAALLSSGGIPRLAATDTDWDELLEARPTDTRPAVLHQQVDELLRTVPAVPVGPLVSQGQGAQGTMAAGDPTESGRAVRTYNSASPGHARADPYQTHSPPVGRWEALHQAGFGPVRGTLPADAARPGAPPGLEPGAPGAAEDVSLMGQGHPAPSLADSLAAARRTAMAPFGHGARPLLSETIDLDPEDEVKPASSPGLARME